MVRRMTEKSSTSPTELAGMTMVKISTPCCDSWSSSSLPPFAPGLVVGSVPGIPGVGLGV